VSCRCWISVTSTVGKSLAAAAGGYRHLPQVVRWNELVHEAVYAQLQQERLPILLAAITA